LLKSKKGEVIGVKVIAFYFLILKYFVHILFCVICLPLNYFKYLGLFSRQIDLMLPPQKSQPNYLDFSDKAFSK